MTKSKALFAVYGAALALAGSLIVPLACQSAGGNGGGSSGGSERRGWLSWRGPAQNGTTAETGLPTEVALDGEGSWTYPLAGRGTPVVVGDRVYTLGYDGEGKELRELLICLDVETGKKVWEHRFSHFLTDVVYYRFAISSPTIDPDTGNVLCVSSSGLFTCFSADGELLWQHSMMAEYGWLSFPNGRMAAPVIDGDLAIAQIISASWGKMAPARNRMYAFDKRTGESVWSSTPGGPPKDGSFSYPVVATEGGRRVLYAGFGGGHLVSVDARTGQTLWRYQMSIGGLSTSPVVYGDAVIAIHGKENLDSSRTGRMISIRRGAVPAAAGPAELEKAAEKWRANLCSFTSSPCLVGNRVYQTILTGDLYCIDADSGEALWHHKLAPDQIHASPAYGDGKLYVPMNNGTFHILRPTDAGPGVLHTIQLEGNCLGAPAIADGRIYVHTNKRLYCFAGGTGRAGPQRPGPAPATPGAATQLQVLPADLVLRQGDTQQFRVRSLDAHGHVVTEGVADVSWSKVPGNGITMSDTGMLTVAADAAPVSVEMGAESGGLRGSVRLRVVRSLPIAVDFEDGKMPTHWVMAGGTSPRTPPRGRKWEVVELDGDKVLARSMGNPLFQRTMSIIGHPDTRAYTAQVDIMTDGNRRTMSAGGLVNQRYLIVLKGNHQELEVSSNVELIKEKVRFRWKAKTWYTLKTRVDMMDDGAARIRAKAWKRGDPEPEAWTIEVLHPNGHTQGAPGVYGFTPQSRFRVYLDNLSVTPND